MNGKTVEMFFWVENMTTGPVEMIKKHVKIILAIFERVLSEN